MLNESDVSPLPNKRVSGMITSVSMKGVNIRILFAAFSLKNMISKRARIMGKVKAISFVFMASIAEQSEAMYSAVLFVFKFSSLERMNNARERR